MHQGVWCLHRQRNMREFRARSRSTRTIFFHVVLLLALVWSCGFTEKCGEANKSSRKCVGKKYYLSEDIARAADQQFAVSIGTKYGGATTGARFDSSKKPFTRPQEIANFCQTFCCPGGHRSNMSWVQARYKVVQQMLHQSGRRNRVYLTSCLYKPPVLRTTEHAS